MKVEIESATVLLTDGPDRVFLKTKLPCPLVPDALPSQPPLDLQFQATYNTGVEYVRKTFGIEPEITKVRHFEVA